MTLKPLNKDDDAQTSLADDFQQQASRLGHKSSPHGDSNSSPDKTAVEARFITHQDAVVKTADGGTLPAVPIEEAVKLNNLKNEIKDQASDKQQSVQGEIRIAKDGALHGVQPTTASSSQSSEDRGLGANAAVIATTTNPLFPPLPLYGPPTFVRELKSYAFRTSSYILGLGFLFVILVGSIFSGIGIVLSNTWTRLKGQSPKARRPFYEEEERRKRVRKEDNDRWAKNKRIEKSQYQAAIEEEQYGEQGDFFPLEGGRDPLVADAGYYARRVGLDLESFDVQTEDGFIIKLWHLYNPREYSPATPNQRKHGSSEILQNGSIGGAQSSGGGVPERLQGEKKYPVLLMHGLLQSGGAYCCNDDDSLAFYLAKSGYDVWVGNNRCGFDPRHNQLTYSDPRMWAWSIRQMGVMDLPALVVRVLEETGFEKLGLVCHSQGSTQTFIALAKEQRPEIGEKISVFCALAPAVYAGPLIEKPYFLFFRIMNRAIFRIVFGIHAFIPFLMQMHRILPGRFYGIAGYHVFSFLFGWNDTQWDRGLRSRMFQFSPTYVSAESMWWWIGKECFAKHKCILSTRREGQMEDEEDREEDEHFFYGLDSDDPAADFSCRCNEHDHSDHSQYAWFNEQAPPLALWVAGNDELVDGRRLIRRFERGREPYVHVVHKKIVEGYEHLDVIWAMDSIEKVGKEVRDVIWRTASKSAREVCRTPSGCEGVEFWEPPPKRTLIDYTKGARMGNGEQSSDGSSPRSLTA